MGSVGNGWPRGGGEIGVAGILCAALDVTDQVSAKRGEETALEELRVKSEALAVVNRAGAAITAEPSVERLTQIVVDAGVTLTGAEFGAFFYNVDDGEGGSYMLYALSGVDRKNFEKFPMPRNTKVFAPTFDGEGVVRSDDILLDPRYGQNAPHTGMPKGHLPVRSYLAVPVKSRDGSVIGGLFFGHGQPGRFSQAAESSLVSLAGQSAVAIDNIRLFVLPKSKSTSAAAWKISCGNSMKCSRSASRPRLPSVSRPKQHSSNRRRWNQSASLPAASPMISTICCK
ncbi:transcriptional regulator with GAF, ATPase, and Fis domain [Rhizobium leguminosarum]